MTKKSYIVINGMHNPYRKDTDEFVFMTFRSEEFAERVTEYLNETYMGTETIDFHVTPHRPEDYLEETYTTLHKELLELVYRSIMGAIDEADRELSKRKPHLTVVK
tara:strand:- start:418 stop:735 length:318 start_codon:yes stop_codon:yes gene_type:complete